uniref:Solute carrier family 22 member 15-like n=1 Tax=Phallusia mammillata TaxID=59560 RepID=A0A6F9DT02_9ASCI|nr:solute carrier family 22 member 15-like [Phallusia mammillata]
MNAEKAFEVVGGFGRFQIIIAAIIYTANFIYAQQMVLMVIVGANSTSDTNLTTIVTEFDLYDKKWVTDLVQSLFMGGYMVGAVAFGQASDIFGRKPVILISTALMIIACFCSGLAQSWQTFAVSRFFGGIFTGGSGVSLYVMLTELVGKNMWTKIGLTYQCCFSLGIMFLAGLSYAIQKWRIICMVSSALGVIVMPGFFFIIPESPRWLYSVGKTDAAEKVFLKIAKWNRKGVAEVVLEPIGDEKHVETHTLLDAFRHKKLAIWLLSLAFVWFTTSLLYYGLTMSAADLTPNLYLGVALSGAVEIPAVLSCIFLMDFKWLGRRGTVFMLLLVCCAVSVTTIFVPASAGTATLALGLTSKLCDAGIFSVIYVYSTEIFPAPLRTVALGTSSTVARIGAIIGSFIPLLLIEIPFLPYILFGATSFLAAMLILVLPVTLNQPLPQTIDDAIKPKYRKKNENDNQSLLPAENTEEDSGVNA